jgi:DNA-binding response OmpR family regulator
LVKEHVPDLIVLDAMLPELHGFDIARRIRGSEKYGAIPIIMVSAVYRGWRIAEDLRNNYGIQEYLEKPFRLADVLASVQRALASADRKGAAPAEEPMTRADADAALAQGIEAYQNGDVEAASTSACSSAKRGCSTRASRSSKKPWSSARRASRP